MRHVLICLAVTGTYLTFGSPLYAGLVNVDQNTNTEVINQIVFEFVDENSNAQTITQNNPVNGNGSFLLARTANIQSITLANGDVLRNFNVTAPTIQNSMFPNTGTVEVFQGANTFSPGDAGFIPALQAVHSNGDIANYIRVDGSDTTSSWELRYSQPVDTSGYFIIQERDGNTDFNLQAVDINGNAIGDTLLFDQNDTFDSYQWDTSVKHYLDPNNNEQTQELSVIDISLFNTGGIDIYGFEVENTGNADLKFFFGSTASMPEPSSAILVFLAGLGLLRKRTRRVIAA